MCGICGQFNFGTEESVNVEDIQKMTSTLSHRGPDDEGYYVADSIGLGFRRLSIIDLEGGHQPMTDPEGSVWVVFNGEIYNFKEIRKELEERGYRFRTNSDTEVIVQGYREWGNNVLNHLNGMFGLAIWDKRAKRLMLARDRMGIKLVYYRLEAGRALFGSEIRPLLASGAGKRELDPVALSLFLRYRYSPSPATVYKGIKKLPPGSRLIIQENETPRLERWSNFAPVPFDPMPTVAQAKEKLLELYSRAVKRQLISDVPVGLLLSGGLDSALLLGLMSGNGNSWNTYTAGYGDAYVDDELSDAAATARLFHSPNAAIRINQATFEASLCKIISALEEPIATSSIVPMYYVCERSRKDVKVVLMGQGPDELFGGYLRHLGVHYGSYWRKLPKWLQGQFGALLSGLSRSDTVKRGLYSLAVSDRFERYQQVFSILPEDSVARLFRKDMLMDGIASSIPDWWQDLQPLMQQTDELGGLQFLEIRSSLPDELLMYADKLSMAHGLEVRVPYLDQEIVEYAERLAASFKIRHGVRKWLHREVAKDFLPEVILRRRKRGFGSNVVDKWFRQSLSTEMIDMLLDPESLVYRYLEPCSVEKLYSDHKLGITDNHKILFSLVVLEQLLRTSNN